MKGFRSYKVFYKQQLNNYKDQFITDKIKEEIDQKYDQLLTSFYETKEAVKKIEEFQEKRKKGKILIKESKIEKKIETIFGIKEGSYFTEDELFEGYKPPKYKDLSESEKNIFNNIK